MNIRQFVVFWPQLFVTALITAMVLFVEVAGHADNREKASRAVEQRRVACTGLQIRETDQSQQHVLLELRCAPSPDTVYTYDGPAIVAFARRADTPLACDVHRNHYADCQAAAP